MYCKTGVRSAETLAIVKGAGYADAVHVGGGVVGLGQPDRPEPAVVLSVRMGSAEPGGCPRSFAPCCSCWPPGRHAAAPREVVAEEVHRQGMTRG